MAKLKSNLSALADQLPSIVQMALDQTGDALVSLIRQKVPVDTGDLRDSYTYEVFGNYVRVGSNQFRGVYRRGHPTFYAPDVELGYTNTPKPHFLPAWQQAKATYRKHFTTLFRELK